ncbi:MAG TPA: hypothetical protein VGL19_14935 [Polyangiaceae bacterium]|jgi:hypothetical protein
MTSTSENRSSSHARWRVPKARHWLVASVLASAAFSAAPRVARAVDPFEIQVYDGTADAPGVPGLELHLNTVPDGKKTASPPELAPNHQSHFTLEPSLGIAPWWELGGYLQSALSPSGKLSYAGAKLRSKFVTPRGWSASFRLGLNLELSLLPRAYERDRWGGEARPIVAFEDPHWLLALNPILEFSLAGGQASAEPSFAPAVMVKFKLEGLAAFGLEYYADLGPISDPDPIREQEQYLFEAFDLLSLPHFELNAGVGEGLTQASSAIVLKAILGYAWDATPLWSPPAR